MIKTQLVNKPPLQFRKNGKLFYKVKIYLDSSKINLDEIDKVVYELHSSFKDSYGVSINKENNFSILIWTYGFFNIKAILLLKNQNTKSVTGYVKWKI